MDGSISINTELSDQKNDGTVGNEYFEKVFEFLSPLRSRWSFVQEVLLWQRLQVSVAVFNGVNVLFWCFITLRLQVFVSIGILLSLLWVITPFRLWVLSNVKSRKLSARDRETGRNGSDNDSSDLTVDHDSCKSTTQEKISYEDICYGIAVTWESLSKFWFKLRKIKEENVPKFYGIVAFLLIALAIFYQRFPVGNILYLTVMFLFLYPAIVFYGIKNSVTGKLHRLFKPFVTQWQSSRTKRRRDDVLPGRQKDSDMSDDDDEDFVLNTNEETEVVLSSALGDQRHEVHNSLENSVVSTDGLEFPSLRRESVESYNSDDFIQGLNFGSFNADAGSCHSSIDSLVAKTDDRLSSENEHFQTTNLEPGIVREPSPLSSEKEPEQQELRHRTREHTLEPPPRNRSADDLQDFELLEKSEIESVLASRYTEETQAQNNSFLDSGTGYVKKLFGYS